MTRCSCPPAVTCRCRPVAPFARAMGLLALAIGLAWLLVTIAVPDGGGGQ